MKRQLRSESELTGAAHHVAFEIEMLVFAGDHLEGWHSSPESSPGGNEKTLALESFLLHFRGSRTPARTEAWPVGSFFRRAGPRRTSLVSFPRMDQRIQGSCGILES